MEDVPEWSDAMATMDTHSMDRSDQESESQPSSGPAHVLGSVISSPLNSQQQLKLKACSDRKAIGKQASKKKGGRRVLPACSHTGVWAFSSSDEDMEASVERLANQGIFTSTEQGDATHDISLCFRESRSSPKGLFRTAREEPVLLNGDEGSGREGSNNWVLPRQTDPGTGPGEVNGTESRPRSGRSSDSGLAGTTGSALWRAESLESICSSTSSLSLAERVEINRTILRRMLQKAHRKSGEGQQTPGTDTRMENAHNRGDSDWDSGISLQDGEQCQRPIVSGPELPLSPRHEQAKLLERARMKARSNPLKADHTIVPVQRDKPELLSWVGAPAQRSPLAGTERVAVGSGNLSDSSSSDSTGCSRRRRAHGQSPSRVRFQDESEKDAEVRYLERQRRRAGERAQGLLGAKPSLAAYINNLEDKQKSRGGPENVAGFNTYGSEIAGQQCNSCGTILKEDVQKHFPPANGESEGRTVPCWVAPTLPNRLVRIEQIKETYIGAMSPIIVESDGTHCRAAGTLVSAEETLQKQKRKSRKQDGGPETTPDWSPKNSPMSNGATALPPNPYCLESLELKVKGLAKFKAHVPAAVASTGEDPGALSDPNLGSPNGRRIVSPQNHHVPLKNTLMGPITPDRDNSRQAGLAEDVESSPNNGHLQAPIITVKQEKEDVPSLTGQRESKAQHALRRFLTAVGLSSGGRLAKSHFSSMEQFNPTLKPQSKSPECPASSQALKKAPSLQNLRLASPFSHLKKSSSVQNLHSPKRLERSTVYAPGELPCSPALSSGLQRALSVDDVGSPSAMRSVGRVAQAFPDGTLLLELNRPPDRRFGFLISRGKGRPDSGVYVEDMGDSSTQKLYAGLLGVGDEILEVNGEKVAGLSLDSVSQLMVQSDTASIRVLRHRSPHR